MNDSESTIFLLNHSHCDKDVQLLSLEMIIVISIKEPGESVEIVEIEI